MATYTKKIYQFRKTKHFLERAHKRAITDEILEYVLRFYQDQKKKKVIAVFSNSLLKKYNDIKKHQHLVIIIHFNYLLITGFWCNDIVIKNFITNKKFKNALIVKFPENQKITKYTEI